MKGETMSLANMFKKIDLYVDGAYYCSTCMFKTVRQAVDSITKAHYAAGKGWSDGIEPDRIKGGFAN